MIEPNIEHVRAFWEANPLFKGENALEVGTKPWFESHRELIITDCFAGKFNKQLLPHLDNPNDKVLDLGCGPGFWVIELAKNGAQNIHFGDLTEQAISITQKRCELYGVEATGSVENAEKTNYPTGHFQHVNCQGVIHHTPNTKACIEEIHRVLSAGGTASISVYYKNFLLRIYPFIGRIFGKFLTKIGFKLPGRAREDIFSKSDVDDIVRVYDGADNPIGKCYSKKEFINLLDKHFEIEKLYYHFFPARALPFPVPKFLHRILERLFPFMIYVNVKKLKELTSS